MNPCCGPSWARPLSVDAVEPHSAWSGPRFCVLERVVEHTRGAVALSYRWRTLRTLPVFVRVDRVRSAYPAAMDDRRGFSLVLLAILAVLVIAVIGWSGWSFWEIVEALVVIAVVIGIFHWLDRRNRQVSETAVSGRRRLLRDERELAHPPVSQPVAPEPVGDQQIL
jgi:hypothetical protein